MKFANESALGKNILSDQTFWYSKLENDYPEILNKLISIKLPNPDWKEIYRLVFHYGFSSGLLTVRPETIGSTTEALQIAYLESVDLPLSQYIEYVVPKYIGFFSQGPQVTRWLIDKIGELTEGFKPDKIKLWETWKTHYYVAYSLYEYLIASVLVHDDLSSLQKLVNIADESPKIENYQTLNACKSIESLKILKPRVGYSGLYMEFYLFATAARVCENVQCVLDFYQDLEIPEAEAKQFIILGLGRLAGMKMSENILPTLVFYLEDENLGTPLDYETIMSSAAGSGNVEIFKYMLKLLNGPEGPRTSEPLVAVVSRDTYPHWLSLDQTDDRINFLNRRLEILKLLLLKPEYDTLDNVKLAFSKISYFTGSHWRKYNTEAVIGQMVKLLTHRLDLPINEMVINEISDHARQLVKSILNDDHRVKSTSSEPKILDIRRIETLKELTIHQKYELMLSLRDQGLLETKLSLALDNPAFVEAYQADNTRLSQLLNSKEIPLIPDVSHGAAAALYADEIDLFNSLVPISRQISH